ncbi:cancer/testis antigen 55-like isoform X2 [Macaca fascicularis]|uniref:cancer/testis antigen 55-like isoform X2 n=1 Tax=Macaca fascicularis TaxID=9541 RepID=UPI0032B06A50
MLRLLRSALAFFRTTADPTEQQRPQQQGPQQQGPQQQDPQEQGPQQQGPQQQGLLEGDTELTTVQGVVTSFCDDYGMIDESIYFSSDVVTGDVPLKIGQKVNVVVEEDKPLYGLRAIKVDVVPHPLNGNGPSDSKLRVLNGCVASISEDTIYISNIIYFPMDIFSEGGREAVVIEATSSEKMCQENGSMCSVECLLWPGAAMSFHCYKTEGRESQDGARRFTEELLSHDLCFL